MGFGNGAFQAARIALDGVTLIQTVTTGKATGYQGNKFFEPVITSPSSNGKAWGFAQVGNFNLKAETSMNAQVSWNNSSDYASVIDAIHSPDTSTILQIDTDICDSATVTSATTATNTIAIGGTGDSIQMALVFITTDGIASGGTVAVTDDQGNTYTQRDVKYIPGTNTAIWEFYTFTTHNSTDIVITATFSTTTNAFMESMPILCSSKPTLAASPFPTDYANDSYVTLGTTPLVSVGSSSYNTIVLSYFGGTTTAQFFISSVGAAYGIAGYPINIHSGDTINSGEGLAYVNSTGIWQASNRIDSTATTDSPPLGTALHWLGLAVRTESTAGSYRSSSMPQNVEIDMSAYSSYLASDLRNVKFVDTFGNSLPQWLESGTSSTTARWWVIPPNKNYTGSILLSVIYLLFYDTATNVFDGTTVGCEPTLSIAGSTFGQYDNGATIFGTGDLAAGIPNYGNFASLPTAWEQSGSPTFSNGVVLSGTSKQYVQTTSNFAANNKIIVEFYGGTTQTGSSSGNISQIGYGNNGTFGGQNVGWQLNGASLTNFTSDNLFGSGSTPSPSLTPTQNANHIWSTWWDSTTTATFGYDYGTTESLSQSSGTTPLNVLIDASANATTISSKWFWYRVRGYISNGTNLLPSSTAVGTIDSNFIPSINGGGTSTYWTMASDTVTPHYTGNLEITAIYQVYPSANNSTADPRISWNNGVDYVAVPHKVVNASSWDSITVSLIYRNLTIGSPFTIATDISLGSGITWSLRLQSFTIREITK